MAQRVQYIIKKDKNGREYALKKDLRTGKSIRVKTKYAKQRITANKSSRKRAKIKAKLKEQGCGGTYQDYQKSVEIVEEEIRERHKKSGKSISESRIKSSAKRTALEHRTGIATRYRFAWIYWLIQDQYVDENGQTVIIRDQSPCFEAGSLRRDGDERFHMIELCQDVFNSVMAQDIYYEINSVGRKTYDVDGGSCVCMYEKQDRTILDKHELGKGCGYSIDLKSTNKSDDDYYDV